MRYLTIFLSVFSESAHAGRVFAHYRDPRLRGTGNPEENSKAFGLQKIMKNENKTKEQLIAELEEMRQRMSELEKGYLKLPEDALGNSDIRSCTLLEGSPVCNKIVDLQSRLRYMSTAGVNRLKITDIERYYGCTFPLDFYPEETRVILTDHLERAKEGEVSSTESPMFDMEGNEVWFHTTFLPARDDEGQIEYIIVTSVDITERKRMEQELLKIQKLESVGNLAGGIAHDFNNLLTAIIGNISLVKMTGQLGEKSLGQLTSAENAGSQAQKLTQRLLTFATGGKPVKKALSPEKLLRETVDFSLSGSKVTADFEISSDIDPIDGDYGQICQVIQNLIINADQAMPNGGVIKLRAENFTNTPKNSLPLDGKEYVKISIADQGIGIIFDNQTRIFDPFFTTKQKGSGLGLATAHSIVHNHGGYIGLDSVLGTGTTFHIYLPVSQENVDASGECELSQGTARGTILVVDDDEFIRQYATDVLEGGGYQVELAKDGAEAVEVYSRAQSNGRTIDLVILDLTIRGGKGGEETLKDLLKIDQEVKAIVSSGYANNPVLADYREYGFRGVVSKPFTSEEMLIAVAKTIHRGKPNVTR